jgi:CheY-like chemotaxis protein
MTHENQITLTRRAIRVKDGARPAPSRRVLTHGERGSVIMRPMTIVVVDDEPEVREMFVDALEGEGHAVHAFAHGGDALDALAAAAVDLLLVDRQMPGLDGFEVARRARAMRPELAIVMVTGDETVRGAVRGAVDRILFKPVSIAEIMAIAEAPGAVRR